MQNKKLLSQKKFNKCCNNEIIRTFLLYVMELKLDVYNY